MFKIVKNMFCLNKFKQNKHFSLKMFIKHKDIGKLLKVIIFVVTLYLFSRYNPVQGHYKCEKRKPKHC